MRVELIWRCFAYLFAFHITKASENIWRNVKCDERVVPDDCDLNKLQTVEDYERCGPAELPLYARNYYLGWSGSGTSYSDNLEAYDRIQIIPQFMRDISANSLEIKTLGRKVAYPIGIAPTGYQKFAHPDGEIATARAALAEKAVMILSSFASFSMEKVVENVNIQSGNFWMQLYIFENRSITINMLRKAENLGFKAIVLTVDSNAVPEIMCDAKNAPEVLNSVLGNEKNQSGFYPGIMTVQDIRWLKSLTSLPIIAKGILTGEDARRAINAGASAILVSNHGGRQLDSVPATIDALPDVIKAVNKMHPRRDVYLDGGIRNGYDVYKALGRGAKMVFVGRPILWGLALQGEEGARNVLDILREEFNTTMLLAGATNPSNIRKESVTSGIPVVCKISV